MQIFTFHLVHQSIKNISFLQVEYCKEGTSVVRIIHTWDLWWLEKKYYGTKQISQMPR